MQGDCNQHKCSNRTSAKVSGVAEQAYYVAANNTAIKGFSVAASPRNQNSDFKITVFRKNKK
jgi:hypothetical protein